MPNKSLLLEHEARFRRIVRRAFLLPIGVMIVAAVLLAWLVGYLLTVTNRVDQTDQVIAQAHFSEKLILDKETTLRAYQVTGSPETLKQFQAMDAGIQEELAKLRVMVSDNPAQVDRLKRIQGEFDEWKAFALEMTGLRQRNGDYQGLKINAEGDALMDRIGKEFQYFTEREWTLRTGRIEAVRNIDSVIRQSRVLVLLVAGLALGLYVRRQMNHVARIYEEALETSEQKARALAKSELSLKEAESRLREYAEELEKTVLQRTEKLRETVGELEAYSYSISHDLRAPLRAMQGYAKLMVIEFSNDLGEEAKIFLNRILAASERMDKLIQDVLSYSRVARADIVPAPMDLNKLIGEIIHQYPGLNPPKVEIVIEGTLPPVLAAEAPLTQCISNLLTNAAKFVPEGIVPRVRIWGETIAAGVKIWFEDNGIGIAPEYQARIFGMFERIPSGSNYEGTGVGLAIVRKAVERMGGQVGVESALGMGSKFWIILPPAKG
jgi:signal transduction histidine kinase